MRRRSFVRKRSLLTRTKRTLTLKKQNVKDKDIIVPSSYGSLLVCFVISTKFNEMEFDICLKHEKVCDLETLVKSGFTLIRYVVGSCELYLPRGVNKIWLCLDTTIKYVRPVDSVFCVAYTFEYCYLGQHSLTVVVPDYNLQNLYAVARSCIESSKI